MNRPSNWQQGRDAFVSGLVRRPFGLITDCDGTISPIVRTPGEAGVDARCRRALSDLAQRLDLVAVVSGRPADLLKGMLGLDGIVYVGNHGLERLQDDRAILAAGVEEYVPALSTALSQAQATLTGWNLVFEDKHLTVGIHYRTSAEPTAARRAIMAVAVPLAKAAGLKVVEGKRVVELRPPIERDKGTAVGELVAEYGLRAGLYFGDDRTDVPALQQMRRLRALGGEFYGVAVLGDDVPPELLAAADFSADGVADVAEVLVFLVNQMHADYGR